MELTDESWAPVKGFESLYEVSTLGRVRRDIRRPMKWPNTNSPPGKILSSATNKDGYPMVCLRRDDTTTHFTAVHRVVADAFLVRGPGLEVNHINGIKTDNRVHNLEVVSHRENMRHAISTGLLNTKRANCTGERHWKAKLCDESVRQIRNMRGVESRSTLASRYGICQATISRIWKRQCWNHV